MQSPVKKKPKPPPPAQSEEQPSAWQEFTDDETGRIYFVNVFTNESRWAPKNIFSDGLPELGALSQSTNFTSNPSVPTDDQHKPARLITINRFSTLSDLTDFRYPKTNIWNQVLDETGTLGGYSNEAGVNSHVERVITDILESLGIRGRVIIRAEVEVMGIRPDFMLILADGHPIGTVEGKQPGKIAMHNPNILGEVYDQLMHLSSIFRVDNPFAILTSYEEWRICWLNLPATNELASTTTIPEITPYQTPTKQNAAEEIDSLESENDCPEDEPSSPPPPPTPSRAKNVGSLQEVDEDVDPADVDGKLDDQDRVFCGTGVMPWTDRSLPAMLASVIRKMMIARQDPSPKVLRLANENTSAWKKAPKQSTLNFSLCISRAVRNFFLWEDLGHGADGKAFLVSGGTRGAVGVLKFFFKDAETKAKHELHMWQEVYSHLPSVALTVRIVTVMGQTALLMPWFQHPPQRNQSTLNAVEETLRKDFQGKHIYHADVAWRNVGIYIDQGETKAVVFDMQRVHPENSGLDILGSKGEDWVTAAVASLSSKVDDLKKSNLEL